MDVVKSIDDFYERKVPKIPKVVWKLLAFGR
jgi:hypothetical protein